MKELNILQAIEMPVGTEFNISDEENNVKVIIKSSDEFINKLRENSTGFISKKFICWANTGEEITLGDYEASLKFIPIQKPVSFIEALKEYSEHKKTIYSVTGTGTKRFYRFDKAGLNSNGEHISAFEILDCDWYIEEEN